MLLDLPLCELAVRGLYRPAHGATADFLIAQFQQEVTCIDARRTRFSMCLRVIRAIVAPRGHAASKRDMQVTSCPDAISSRTPPYLTRAPGRSGSRS